MADKVIKELEQLKHCITTPCDITCSYYNAEDMICPCSYDVSSDVTIDNAIQTIRELRELNKGLSETNTSNPMYEIGYKKGASDMEKAKQIIIDKLQEQIPKWHLVADGDLPTPYDIGSRPILKMSQYLVKRKIGNYAVAYYEHIYEDCWVLNGMKIDDVIAWMELPKFSEVE